MGLVELLTYLVTKQLCGSVAVDVVYRHYVLGHRISDLAREYGLTKDQVRSFKVRVLEKADGSAHRAAAMLKYVYPYVKEIEPIIHRDGDRCRCLLCNKDVVCDLVYIHVAFKHYDYVDFHVDRIMRLLAKKFNHNNASF